MARYPKPNRPIKEIAYQSMVELLSLLRANSYQTWICSGGTTSFIRVLSQNLYGIPPSQMIGTTLKSETRMVDGVLSVYRLPALELFNDQAVKPANLSRALGSRPVFAGGNIGAAGDLAMLSYSKGRTGPSFQLLINLDDEVRESAYAEKDGTSLPAAAQSGFTVVSIAHDWKQIYSTPRTSLIQQKSCCDGGTGRAGALLSRMNQSADTPASVAPVP